MFIRGVYNGISPWLLTITIFFLLVQCFHKESCLNILAKGSDFRKSYGILLHIQFQKKKKLLPLLQLRCTILSRKRFCCCTRLLFPILCVNLSRLTMEFKIWGKNDFCTCLGTRALTILTISTKQDLNS